MYAPHAATLSTISICIIKMCTVLKQGKDLIEDIDP